MVESLALRIAKVIKKAEPNHTASIEVLKFSLEFIINTFISLLIIVSIGWVSGSLGETLLGLGAFVILRFFSGGFHFQKAMHCSFLSALLISTAPHISLTGLWVKVLVISSLILIMLFAPSNIEGHARIPNKYFPLLKLGSALIIVINLFAMNSTIAAVHFIQALTTIPIKRR